MKVVGKKKHPTLGEIDDLQLEDSDFDFTKKWDEISIATKAKFMYFLGKELLDEKAEKEIRSIWQYYKNEHSLNEK